MFLASVVGAARYEITENQWDGWKDGERAKVLGREIVGVGTCFPHKESCDWLDDMAYALNEARGKRLMSEKIKKGGGTLKFQNLPKGNGPLSKDLIPVTTAPCSHEIRVSTVSTRTYFGYFPRTKTLELKTIPADPGPCAGPGSVAARVDPLGYKISK